MKCCEVWGVGNESLVTLESRLQRLYFVEDKERFSYLNDVVSSCQGYVRRQLVLALAAGYGHKFELHNKSVLELLREAVSTDMRSGAGGGRVVDSILECACSVFAAELLQAYVSGRLTLDFALELLQGRPGEELLWRNVIYPLITECGE